MSKLGCPCGHVIADNTDRIPYKAAFVRNQHDEMMYDRIVADLTAFVSAVRDGSRDAWVQNHFNGDWSLSLTDADVVHDIVSGQLMSFQSDIYQCQACGRIHVQSGLASQLFRPFRPEEGDSGPWNQFEARDDG